MYVHFVHRRLRLTEKPIQRMDWLNSLLETVALLEGIAHTKIRQFAAEAEALEATDMLSSHNTPKCHTLLICLIHLYSF